MGFWTSRELVSREFNATCIMSMSTRNSVRNLLTGRSDLSSVPRLLAAVDGQCIDLEVSYIHRKMMAKCLGWNGVRENVGPHVWACQAVCLQIVLCKQDISKRHSPSLPPIPSHTCLWLLCCSGENQKALSGPAWDFLTFPAYSTASFAKQASTPPVLLSYGLLYSKEPAHQKSLLWSPLLFVWLVPVFI